MNASLRVAPGFDVSPEWMAARQPEMVRAAAPIAFFCAARILPDSSDGAPLH
jgi:hypothetical protein